MNENKSQVFSCSGEGESKHPHIYFLLKSDHPTLCPYCSKSFPENKNEITKD